MSAFRVERERGEDEPGKPGRASESSPFTRPQACRPPQDQTTNTNLGDVFERVLLELLGFGSHGDDEDERV